MKFEKTIPAKRGELVPWGGVRAAAAGLALTLFFLLLPLGFFGPEGDSAPRPTATLPLDRTPATPAPGRDAGQKVRVKLDSGDVLTLSLERYLWRVVAAEMPASFRPDALMAQAVAARTYTVSKMGRQVENHPDADVCTDIGCCQAYLDPGQAEALWGSEAQRYTEKIAAAVAQTDGVIASYDGQPIQAVFFSSAAGRTLDAVEVWGRAVPYLTGVESPEGEGDVPGYHTDVTVTAEEFRAALLAAHPEAELTGAPETWLGETVHNSAGGVAGMTVGGVYVAGTELRSLLGLRSTAFTVSAGEEELTFSVTGYGHAVGMSQYGANTLAEQGKTWQEILGWYYTGVELTYLEGAQP